jgi:hypothetical protein
VRGSRQQAFSTARSRCYQPGCQSTVEREIKLASITISACPLSASAAATLPTSTYYDTSQYDRPREDHSSPSSERGKQAWQLKLPLMKDRQEIELVDRQSIPPATFRDLLLLHLGRRRLVPVATLRVWRTGIRARMDHAPVADVTLDHVAVVKNGAVLQRFRELEIEQVNGKDSTLPDLERQLRRAGACA